MTFSDLVAQLNAMVINVANVNAALREMTKRIQELIGGAATPPGPKEALKPKPVASFSEQIGAIVAPIAATTGALTSLIAAAGQFVSVINPTLMELFNATLKNIAATIGSALEPIFMILVGTLRTVNDIIGPMFDQLRPIVEKLTTLFVQLLVPIVKVIVAMFSAWAPVLDLIVELMKPLIGILVGFAEVYRAWMLIMGSFIESIVKWLSGTTDLKDNMKAMTDAIMAATKALILFMAHILKFFGLDTALKALLKGFAPPTPGAGKLAAPTDIGITGLDEILKASQSAAAAASGAGAVRTTEDLLGDITGKLKEIIDGTSKFETFLLTQFGPWGPTILAILTTTQAILAVIQAAFSTAGNLLPAAVQGSINPIAGVLTAGRTLLGGNGSGGRK